MATTQSNFRQKKNVLGWAFMVSSLILIIPDLISQMLLQHRQQGVVFMQNVDKVLDRFSFYSPLYMEFNGTIMVSLFTLLGSMVSLVGFILFSLLVWKQGHKAQVVVVQESQKLEQILADFQLEIDRRLR